MHLTIVILVSSQVTSFSFVEETDKLAQETSVRCPINKCGDTSDNNSCFQFSGNTKDGNRINTYYGCDDSDKYCYITSRGESDITLCRDKIDTETYGVEAKYPGEKCSKSHECVDVLYFYGPISVRLQKCEDGKCKGNVQGEQCSGNSSCIVGTYCDTKSNPQVCTPLLAVDSNCSEDEQCVSGTVCEYKQGASKKTCIEVYSFPDYSDITKNDNKGLLCESMYYHRVGDKYICARRDYEAVTATDGFVTCQSGEICKYTVQIGAGQSVIDDTQYCVCSEYSEEGQGYCPYAEDNVDMKDRYEDIRENMKELLGKDLHVRHRDQIDDEQYGLDCIDFYTNPKYKEYQSCIADKMGSLDTRSSCKKHSKACFYSYQLILLLVLLAFLM